MQQSFDRPIFVVGSPRSGTSILAWCLGQHPNIFPVPESNWMGDFATNVALSYQIGAARGDRTILSAMDVSRDEFFANFGRSINNLILCHRMDMERKRETERLALNIEPRWLEVASAAMGPKQRWVDGTPEYSLHIYGLRKLFPDALFIHIVRDVGSVVRSLLNFHRVSGTHLVANEEEAYKYWLRRVSACLQAEKAYGPRVIHRLSYSALIDNPELAFRSLLDFVDEPYSAKCLEPLAQRINSSNVPPDFKSNDPATDPAIVKEALQLSAFVEQTPQPNEASAAAVAEMETAFEKRAHYFATLGSVYQAEKSRLESVITAYQEANKAYHEANKAYEEANTDLQKQLTHSSDKISEISSELHDKTLTLAEQERYVVKLTSQLRKQLGETRKLSRLLDNVQEAAERLRMSRRWKLINLPAVIRAKLFGSKVPRGYGHFEKIMATYSQWRASHADITKMDDRPQPGESSNPPGNSDKKVDDLSAAESIHRPIISKTSVETKKACRS